MSKRMNNGALVARAPHRFGVHDSVSTARRPDVGEVMDQLRARGLDDLASDDLEVYRLVLSPAAFKRLCHRLEAELTALHQSQPVEVLELPFGADLAGEVRRDRLRAWVERPNGEVLPRCWSIETAVQLPGRLRLVAGREFSVRGERGRFLFRHGVTTDTGERWVECWDAEGRWRSIRPERIRVVHVRSKRRRQVGVVSGSRRARARVQPLGIAHGHDSRRDPDTNTTNTVGGVADVA